MTNIHPDTWIWLVEVTSDFYDPMRIAVAADTPEVALMITYMRYSDTITARIIGNGMRLIAEESPAIASRKASV